MKLEEFLTDENIKLNLGSRKKASVIEELVELLPVEESIKSMLKDNLLKREKMGSTGVGKGIAIPHCRSVLVDKLTIIIGRSKRGIDFDAQDGKPVHLLFLVVAPPQPRPLEYLVILGEIAKLSKKIVKHPDILKIDEKERFLNVLFDIERKLEKRRR